MKLIQFGTAVGEDPQLEALMQRAVAEGRARRGEAPAAAKPTPKTKTAPMAAKPTAPPATKPAAKPAARPTARPTVARAPRPHPQASPDWETNKAKVAAVIQAIRSGQTPSMDAVAEARAIANAPGAGGKQVVAFLDAHVARRIQPGQAMAKAAPAPGAPRPPAVARTHTPGTPRPPAARTPPSTPRSPVIAKTPAAAPKSTIRSTVTVGPVQMVPKGISANEWHLYQRVSRDIYEGKTASVSDLKKAHAIALKAGHKDQALPMLETALKAAGVAVPAAKAVATAPRPAEPKKPASAAQARAPQPAPRSQTVAKAPASPAPEGVSQAEWEKTLRSKPANVNEDEWRDYVSTNHQLVRLGKMPLETELAVARHVARKTGNTRAATVYDALLRKDRLSVDELIHARSLASKQPRVAGIFATEIALAAKRSGSPSDLEKAHKVMVAAGMTATAASLAALIAQAKKAPAETKKSPPTDQMVAAHERMKTPPPGISAEDWRRYWAIQSRMSDELFEKKVIAAPDQDYFLVEAIALKQKSAGPIDIINRHFKTAHNGVTLAEYKSLLSTQRAIAQRKAVSPGDIRSAIAVAQRMRNDKGDALVASLSATLRLPIATRKPTGSRPVTDDRVLEPSFMKEKPVSPPGDLAKAQKPTKAPPAPTPRSTPTPTHMLPPPVLVESPPPPVFVPPQDYSLPPPAQISQVPVMPPPQTVADAARTIPGLPAPAVAETLTRAKENDSQAQAAIAAGASLIRDVNQGKPEARERLENIREGVEAGNPTAIKAAAGIAAAGAATGAVIATVAAKKRRKEAPPAAEAERPIPDEMPEAPMASIAGQPGTSSAMVALGVGLAGLGLIALTKSKKRAA